jgi:glycosyltransferase involved in cell wall biosynthesis
MRKNVCMFVWNHFTNDARVLRECTALSDEGYNVDLICIDDPKDEGLPKFEERNPYFKIYRVRRYPLMLELLQKCYKGFRKNKVLGILAAFIWLFFAYLQPFILLPLTGVLFVLLKTKLSVIWVRGSIILRMILRGFQKNYDIFHSNDLNTLPQGYVCSKIRLKKKKLVYDSHEVQTSRTGYNSPLYGKFEAFFIKRIDTMIVENQTRANYNKELYGFFPNFVHNYPFKQVEQSIEIVPLHQMLDLPKDEKILLYQGGIQTGRGLENLIEAAPLFKQGTLVFIGDGKIKNKLEEMVKERKLENKVKFIPKVPLADLPKYTKNAYLGFQVLNNVCFNHFSASSNKLFEYMMSGVPVVACDFPEIKRVVEGERVGLCIDSHNYQEIAHAVNTLLDDIDLRNELSKNCITAKEKYNWDIEKEKFLDIYQTILA